METRDTVFLVVMVLSSFLLSFEWLRRFEYASTNPLIILSINNKLQEFEDKIEAKDRTLKVNMESTETKIDERMNELSSKVENAICEFNRRKYH